MIDKDEEIPKEIWDKKQAEYELDKDARKCENALKEAKEIINDRGKNNKTKGYNRTS